MFIFLIIIVFSIIMIILTSRNQRKAKKSREKNKNKRKSEQINRPISDKEIPGLIKLGYLQALEEEKQSKNIKFHRTEREEELSFQFEMNHGNQIGKYVNAFEDCYRLAFSEKDLNKKIELLEKTIIEFEKAKIWFYRTKGGTIYFQDMYEHLHNSNNDDWSYIDQVEDYLEECIYERDYIISKLLEIIKSSSDGILQKDIYQHLTDVSKSHIQKLIRNFESEGLITREKSKGSYLLTIKQPQ